MTAHATTKQFKSNATKAIADTQLTGNLKAVRQLPRAIWVCLFSAC